MKLNGTNYGGPEFNYLNNQFRDLKKELKESHGGIQSEGPIGTDTSNGILEKVVFGDGTSLFLANNPVLDKISGEKMDHYTLIAAKDGAAWTYWAESGNTVYDCTVIKHIDHDEKLPDDGLPINVCSD